MDIGGTKYKLRPLTVGAYADLEAYIASLRPDPLEAAAKAVENPSIPAKHHATIWETAMREASSVRIVTAREIAEFESDINGLAWSLWQSLKADHPEIDSVESAKALLIKAGVKNLERIARTLEMSSGEADLKKSTGQAVEAEKAADLAGQ